MPNKENYIAIKSLLESPNLLRPSDLAVLKQNLIELKKIEEKEPIEKRQDFAFHFGCTPLMIAVRHHKPNAIDIILKQYPLSVNTRNNLNDAEHGYSLGHTALMIAIEKGTAEDCEKLLSQGADIKQVYEKAKNENFSFFERAIIKNQTDKVEVLTKYGAVLTNTKLIEHILEPEMSKMYFSIQKGAKAGNNKQYCLSLEKHKKPIPDPEPMRVVEQLSSFYFWRTKEYTVGESKVNVSNDNTYKGSDAKKVS